MSATLSPSSPATFPDLEAEAAPRPRDSAAAAPPPRSFDLARLDDAAPSWLAVAGALSGHLVLGACFALGRSLRTGGDVPLAAVFGTLGAQVGGLCFAIPSLLVLHPFLGMRARPEALLRALAWAAVRHGRLALALAPIALLFCAAGRVTTGVHLLCFYGLGGLGCWTLLRAVVAAEVQANPRGVEGATLLAFAWTVLTAAVGISLFAVGSELVR